MRSIPSSSDDNNLITTKLKEPYPWENPWESKPKRMKMDRLLQAMAGWFQRTKNIKRKQRKIKSKSSSSSIESCSSSKMSSTSSSSSNSAIETLLQIPLSPINPLEQHTSFKIYDDGDCLGSSPEADDGLYEIIDVKPIRPLPPIPGP